MKTRKNSERVLPTTNDSPGDAAASFHAIMPFDHAASHEVERAASGQPELQAAAPCSPAHVAADDHGRIELSLAPAQPKESSVTIRESEVPLQRLELQPRLPKAQMPPAPHLKSGTPAGTSFLIAPSSPLFGCVLRVPTCSH